MSGGQKRKITRDDALNSKKSKISATHTPVRRDLLERCYRSVCTLREHILLKLPSSSRLRRKKISSIGQGSDISEVETRLVHLLDTSLVCTRKDQQNDPVTRREQWLLFSQKGDESYVSISNGLAGSTCSQSEVCILVYLQGEQIY